MRGLAILIYFFFFDLLIIIVRYNLVDMDGGFSFILITQLLNDEKKEVNKN